MARKTYRSTWVLGLAVGALVSVAAGAADMAGNNGVTFINSGNRQISLYTRYGSDASCEAKPKSETVTVAPGQTSSLDSGGSDVCFCLEVPDRQVCPTGWSTVKSGKSRHFK